MVPCESNTVNRFGGDFLQSSCCSSLIFRLGYALSQGVLHNRYGKCPFLSTPEGKVRRLEPERVETQSVFTKCFFFCWMHLFWLGWQKAVRLNSGVPGQNPIITLGMNLLPKHSPFTLVRDQRQDCPQQGHGINQVSHS